MIRIVEGDLLRSGARYICHQVNCQGVMGSGVAKQIREKWPDVYDRYKVLCDRYSGNREQLLGRAQGVRVTGYSVVVNLFGQNQYGRDGSQYTDINALRRGCETLSAHANLGDTIAMPYRIGCGLGGGDWGKVMDMLTGVFREHYLTLYIKCKGG